MSLPSEILLTSTVQGFNACDYDKLYWLSIQTDFIVTSDTMLCVIDSYACVQDIHTYIPNKHEELLIEHNTIKMSYLASHMCTYNSK